MIMYFYINFTFIKYFIILINSNKIMRLRLLKRVLFLCALVSNIIAETQSLGLHTGRPHHQWRHQGRCRPAPGHPLDSLKNKVRTIKNDVFFTRTFYFLNPDTPYRSFLVPPLHITTTRSLPLQRT
jgi:hypothetical protein